MNMIPPPTLIEAPQQSTYGQLIDLLSGAEQLCSRNPELCVKHVLVTVFTVYTLLPAAYSKTFASLSLELEGLLHLLSHQLEDRVA